MRSWQRTVSVAAAAMMLAACGERGGDGDSQAARGGAGGERAEAEEDTSPGATLYRAACIMCHDAGGTGTQLGPPLAGATVLDSVIAVVREGVPEPEAYPVPMPPRGNGSFDDEQIRAVSEYVLTLGR
jgi:mono/diheme cytochrome c family protein